MQNVSKEYKQSMSSYIRNRGYIKATIGVINSEAQRNIELDQRTEITYFSDIKKPFDSYVVEKPYATAEQDFSKVDGSMYFLPKESSGLSCYNQGIVTKDILGSVYISFNGVSGLDIKGLTIDFGDCFPVDFTIENDTVTKKYTGNTKRKFITEDVFDGTSYFIIRPQKMINGQGRLRIYQFFCGIVNSFNNNETIDYSIKEHVSPITETIPSVDMSLTVDNRNSYYSPDNPESTLAYFEIGQEIKVSFGYDVSGNRNIEWLPEQTAYLKTWTANDKEAKFTATDRFDYMTEKYYKGMYRESGISLYDLAIDVLNDAGITDERQFFVDPYLKKIKVKNPLPVKKHSEELQIIANAGRCILFEDRNKRINIMASFIPDMTSESNGETEYSHVENILNREEKDAYAIKSNNFSIVDGSLYFMPKNGNYLKTGYVSSSIWKNGSWSGEAPKIIIRLEAAFVAYGIIIKFRNVAPEKFKISTYYENNLVQEFVVLNEELEYVTQERFELFDRMEIDFIEGHPNARVTIDNILIGDVTDYTIRRNDMMDSPVAKRQEKIKSISVVRSIYKKSSNQIKEISSEDILISPVENVHTIHFNKPYYNLKAEIVGEDGNVIETGISVEIADQSNYFATLRFYGMGSEAPIRYSLKGYEFSVEEISYTKKYRENGKEISWKNPLIGDLQISKELEEWISLYYLGDVDYQIKWCGDPSTDPNDLFYLELKDREKTMIRCYQNELKYNGAWSGTMKARKVDVKW